MSDQPEPPRHAISAAYTLTGAILGLGMLGYLLDMKFDTKPYLLLTGLLLGVVVGLYDLWKVMFPPEDKQ
ncbi:MAG: AtpZ/AtpI family protein [Fidelibacterota bacterium]|nr:MAG: AtpZ/AtpI family protein [Candidatus Neomarinimicrobiota bacterium]